MKKLLALVLALVMTLGLATVGANAAYKDADSINYKEAVDVMTAIGVLAGDETGFRPADTLKRSEGAKIIAYLIAGQATADAMTATGTKYTDLPANHWAAGYMEYLSAIGVMGGLGNGTIDPDGSLSATAFAKMLLVALGYDATIEKMGGADWQINTQRLANKVGLFKGNSAVVGSAAITREEAALYALNTLKAPVVEYETKGTSIVVGDAAITTGASNATYMTTTDSSARYTNIANDRVNGNGAQIVEFAEQYYDGLKLAKAGTDAFERPANVWTLKGKEVGTYAKASDLQYTAEVKMGTIYTDLGLTSTIPAEDVTIYEDGVKARDYTYGGQLEVDHSAWPTYNLIKGSTKGIGGNGALTEVYYDDDADTVEIFVTNTYFAKVEAAYAATSTKDAYVTLGSLSANTNTGEAQSYSTDKFKAGDYVLYTASYKDNATPDVQSMELANAIQGKLSAYTEKTSVTVDGTVIKSNVMAGSKATIDDKLQNAIDTTVTVYKDKYDYAVSVDATAASDAYAVLVGWSGVNTVGSENRTVTLLFADGTKKTVTSNGYVKTDTTDITFGTDDVAKNENPQENAEANVGDIVTYKVNSSGYYKLTRVAGPANYAENDVLIEKGSSYLNENDGLVSGVHGAYGTIKRANGNTTFLFYNTKSGTAAVYTGIANVPDVVVKASSARASVYKKATNTSAYADLVFVDTRNATVTNSSKDVIFVKGGSANPTYEPGYGNYYQYDAIINGEITKIKLDDKQSTYAIMTNLAKDSKDVYDLETAVDYANENSVYANGDVVGYGKGTDALKNGTITLGDNALSVASDCKVFSVAVDGTITASTIGAIQKDGNDLVYYKITSDEVTTIVRVVKDGTNEVADTEETVDGVTLVKAKATSASTITLRYEGATPYTSSEGIALIEALLDEPVDRYNTVSGKAVTVGGDTYTITQTRVARVYFGTTLGGFVDLNANNQNLAGNANLAGTITAPEGYYWIPETLRMNANTSSNGAIDATVAAVAVDTAAELPANTNTKDVDKITYVEAFKVASTDSSITHASLTYNDTASHYETFTSGAVIQKGITVKGKGKNTHNGYAQLNVNDGTDDVLQGSLAASDGQAGVEYTYVVGDGITRHGVTLTLTETTPVYEVWFQKANTSAAVKISPTYLAAGEGVTTNDALNNAEYDSIKVIAAANGIINSGNLNANITRADNNGTRSITVKDADAIAGKITFVQLTKIAAAGTPGTGTHKYTLTNAKAEYAIAGDGEITNGYFVPTTGTQVKFEITDSGTNTEVLKWAKNVDNPVDTPLAGAAAIDNGASTGAKLTLTDDMFKVIFGVTAG